jgi:hypothetical protein
MMPVVLLCGASGSGKDTVAEILREEFGAVSLAMADPMKRFVRRVFDFPTGVLWGESSLRNSFDARFGKASEWVEVGARFRHEHEKFAQLVAPDVKWTNPAVLLSRWFERSQKHALEQGGVSPRYLLQTLGTEWGRHIDANMWVNFSVRAATSVLLGQPYHYAEGFAVDAVADPPPLAVITDGRFPNEVLRVRQAGGVVVLIECEGSNTAASQAAGVQGHASETSLSKIPLNWFDAVLANDKRSGLGPLRETVVRMFSELVGNERVPVYTPTVVSLEG